jgi:CPA1 family monovalent cation:H+ antiporter
MSPILLQVLTFSFLLLLFACIKHYTRNSKLPTEAWILLVGISYGLLEKEVGTLAWPNLVLDPNAILFFFLPLLIYASGRHVDVSAMRAKAWPIMLYAFPGVILTSVLIGFPVAWALDIHYLHGMLFGAAIGATDPIAVGAIFQKFSMNKQLDMLVEGESLFNDGTTVVLFSLLSSLVILGSEFNFSSAVGEFVYAVGLSIPIGLVSGWLASKVLKSWSEQQMFFGASMGIISAFLIFALCEYVLHVSGVIAVLMASLMMEHLSKKTASTENIKLLDSFWSYLSQTLNGFMFFLLGVATGLHEFNLPVFALIVGFIAMLAARCVVIYGGGGILRIFSAGLPASWQHVMVLGGLRGAVSAALILLIPDDYAQRDNFLCLAFFLIAFSLIVQPLVMQRYLEKLKKSDGSSVF